LNFTISKGFPCFT